MRSDVIEAHAAIANREVRWRQAHQRAVGSWIVGLLIVIAVWTWAPFWLVPIVLFWVGYVGVRETIRAGRARESWERAVGRRNCLLAIGEREMRIAAADALMKHLDRGGDPDDMYARVMRAEMDKPNGYYTRNWG